MDLFPFEFNKPPRNSFMIWLNSCILIIILITIIYINHRRYTKVLNFCKTYLNRFQWIKKNTIPKENFIFKKVKIIDNNSIFTIECFMGNQYIENQESWDTIRQQINNTNGYYKVSFHNNNGLLLIVINNIVDKEEIKNIISIIEKIHYNK